MALISYTIREFILSRLTDDESGFIYWWSQCAPTYSLQPITLVQGTNLFTGSLTAPQIDETGDGLYPLMVVNSVRAINKNYFTPSEFSGEVQTDINFWTSFTSAPPPFNAENLIDCFEDAVTETYNRADYIGLSPDNTVYNNELSFQRFPLAFAGSNWLQLTRCSLTHQLVTTGR